MLKTTSRERGWIALAAVLWIVLLIGIIFIPQSRPSAAQAGVTPTNSLTRSIEQIKPAGGVVAAELVDMTRVYDENLYGGFITVCPGEPEEYVEMKLDAVGLESDALDMSGDNGYMLLFPAAEGVEPHVDTVPLDRVNICLQPMLQGVPLQQPMAFGKAQGQWLMLG